MIRLPVRTPAPISRPVRVLRTRPVAAIDFNEGVALTGKFLGTWVLFTATMNWWRYKREAEKKDRS